MNDASGLTATAPQSATLAMTLRRAATFAQQRSHRYVTLEHLLLALVDDQDAVTVLRSVNYDIDPLRARASDVVNRYLSTLYAPGNTDLRPSYKLDRVLQVASSDAGKSPHGEVDGAFVIAALTAESDSVAAGLLRQHGLGFPQAMGWIYANRSGRKAGNPQNPPIGRAPSQSRPSSNGAGKLEDMLSMARQTMEREEPAPRTEARGAPNPARQQSGSGHRGEPKFNQSTSMPGNVRAAPPPDTAFNPAAYPPDRAPRRERTLSAALENVRPDAAAQPQARPSSGRALVVSKTAGKLAETIPRRMRIGVAAPIEIRISRDETAALFRNFKNPGAPEASDAVLARAMTVMLKAPDGGFIIETQAPETQWVFDRPSFLETERFGRWRWTVTPSASGKRRLQLVASARSIDGNGMAGDMVTPDQVIEVRIRGNFGRGLRKLMLWIFLLIAGGVLAETALRFGPFLLR